MDYIFIDGVAVLSLGYAMTLSYPEDKLAKVILRSCVSSYSGIIDQSIFHQERSICHECIFILMNGFIWQVRPTSSLLGPLNVTSVVGVWVINLLYLVGALGFMVSHVDYVKWPAV